jgi:hypothetical protein
VSVSAAGVLATEGSASGPRGWSLYDWRADALRFTTPATLWSPGGPAGGAAPRKDPVVLAVAVSPDGTRVAVADEDGVLRVWDVTGLR